MNSSCFDNTEKLAIEDLSLQLCLNCYPGKNVTYYASFWHYNAKEGREMALVVARKMAEYYDDVNPQSDEVKFEESSMELYSSLVHWSVFDYMDKSYSEDIIKLATNFQL